MHKVNFYERLDFVDPQDPSKIEYYFNNDQEQWLGEYEMSSIPMEGSTIVLQVEGDQFVVMDVVEVLNENTKREAWVNVAVQRL